MVKVKKMLRFCMVLAAATVVAISFNTSAFAKENGSKKITSYQTVTEVHDWGAAVTKVIVDLGKPVQSGAVDEDTFTVRVRRSDDRMANPFLEEGYRTVTNAYVSNKKGTPAAKGKYAVLEMKIGPNVSLGSPLNYYNGLNVWIDNAYTILQVKDIPSNSGAISGLVAKRFDGGTREIIDDFSKGKFTHQNKTLTYADFTPAKDKKKNPLIIWLHGGGEGGTDPTIPLAANKAVSFATEETQSIFGGAYVLAPQAPTRWMQGFSGGADGTSVYEEALKALIDNYVAKHPDIDEKRIYIGGASNGGYMTMLMIRDYPGYFAAAYPVCEGLNNSLISDQDIQNIKQTPAWFVAAKTDTTLPVAINTVPTFNRLKQAGAENVHLSLFDDVHDLTGLYKNSDGSPYQYNGHWSWIYVYNNVPALDINGKRTTIMEWLASQSR
ncbi:prolyl oligopeptidase family serine peptidase [Fictibacillus fluitans]|uniref:Prolyl oligopeptidase family serine peptidase n=1 Tax=Fictibacillus fluitans TaxID=3058422 RepID=A0ABT8HQ67_9BACL|nr:prolyl oligopeptidase family serine peptidase [Fictibacillus sp. NE201]MDN4522914.1 prolyl oligopeptidase family serine peptidase [Fictibacillus sp. NE201]